MNRDLPILMALMFLAGCAVWPMGEDPSGKAYRDQANVLVEALVQYQKEYGELPPTIEALIPKFIQKLPEVANLSFYSKEKESLVYIYSPSWPQLGKISCGTVISSGKWGCHGYI